MFNGGGRYRTFGKRLYLADGYRAKIGVIPGLGVRRGDVGLQGEGYDPLKVLVRVTGLSLTLSDSGAVAGTISDSGGDGGEKILAMFSRDIRKRTGADFTMHCEISA